MVAEYQAARLDVVRSEVIGGHALFEAVKREDVGAGGGKDKGGAKGGCCAGSRWGSGSFVLFLCCTDRAIAAWWWFVGRLACLTAMVLAVAGPHVAAVCHACAAALAVALHSRLLQPPSAASPVDRNQIVHAKQRAPSHG